MQPVDGEGEEGCASAAADAVGAEAVVVVEEGRVGAAFSTER